MQREIRSRFSNLVQTIHAREKQLLRQAEAIYRQQMSVAESNEDIALASVCVVFEDADELSKQIRTFGRIDLCGTAGFRITNQEPYEIAEYQDSMKDHVSFDKFIAENSEGAEKLMGLWTQNDVLSFKDETSAASTPTLHQRNSLERYQGVTEALKTEMKAASASETVNHCDQVVTDSTDGKGSESEKEEPDKDKRHQESYKRLKAPGEKIAMQTGATNGIIGDEDRETLHKKEANEEHPEESRERKEVGNAKECFERQKVENCKESLEMKAVGCSGDSLETKGACNPEERLQQKEASNKDESLQSMGVVNTGERLERTESWNPEENLRKKGALNPEENRRSSDGGHPEQVRQWLEEILSETEIEPTIHEVEKLPDIYYWRKVHQVES